MINQNYFLTFVWYHQQLIGNYQILLSHEKFEFISGDLFNENFLMFYQYILELKLE
jgi:hypothetical protein